MSALTTLFTVCALALSWSLGEAWHWPLTTASSTERGHYPKNICHLTDVVLNYTDGIFYVRGNDDLVQGCNQISGIWKFKAQQDVTSVECGEVYDVGHTFPIFYLPGASNYYHLHYDMMLPLFKALYYQKDEKERQKRQVLMPLAESRRLQIFDWDTKAFLDPSKYWYQTIEVMAGKHDLKPLDRHLREQEQMLCFEHLFAGTEAVNFSDETFVKSFVRYIKEALNVDQDLWKRQPKPRVALISRSRKRMILNEEELVQAVAHITDLELLKFETMTFKEQVAVMQKYDVVLGINGAGLMNGIYLPPHGVVVQLVPFEAGLNFKQYGTLLQARGPYMVWHNTHANLTVEFPKDTYKNKSNTIVHIEEFVALVEEALTMAAKHKQTTKDEL